MNAPDAEPNPLTLREAFSFPLATPEARDDLVIGATALLLPLVGWILNLGHRLDVVHRIFHDRPPYYRGFAPWTRSFRRGLKAFTAITLYLSPSVGVALLGLAGSVVWFVPASALFVLAIFSLPGGMTYNAAYDDISYLYRPDRAFRRAVEGGRAYLHAWAIGIAAISLSFLGLFAFGIGFLYTSVWAWMVVGYAFSRALSLRERERSTLPGPASG